MSLAETWKPWLEILNVFQVESFMYLHQFLHLSSGSTSYLIFYLRKNESEIENPALNMFEEPTLEIPHI